MTPLTRPTEWPAHRDFSWYSWGPIRPCGQCLYCGSPPQINECVWIDQRQIISWYLTKPAANTHLKFTFSSVCGANPHRWIAHRTSGSYWRTKQSLAQSLQRNRRCCSSLHKLVSTSVFSVFAPGLHPLRRRLLPEPISLQKGWCWWP